MSEHVHLDQVYTPATVGRADMDITTTPPRLVQLG